MKTTNNVQDRFEKQKNILIKTKEKTNRNNNIIVFIIVIITLISSLLTFVFTYKLFKNTEKFKDDEVVENKKYYQTLSVIYNDDSKIKIENITNNYALNTPKIITLINEGNSDMSINIKLANIKTNLSVNTNFIYEITKNGETSLPKEMPLSDSTIVSDFTLSAGERIIYLLNIKFTGIIDNNIQNTYYNADIIVEQNNKTDLLK